MSTTLSRIEEERLAGPLAVIVAAVGLVFANTGVTEGESGGVREFVVSLAICVVVAAFVFGRVLPRAERLGLAAGSLAGLSVVSVLAYWSGVPVVLGIAALVAGVRAGGPGGTAAALVGGLATVAALVASVVA